MVTAGPGSARRVRAGTTAGSEGSWSEVVRVATGAGPAAALGVADLVVALRPPTPAEVGQLRRGQAATPEDGARLFVACAGMLAIPDVDAEMFDAETDCDDTGGDDTGGDDTGGDGDSTHARATVSVEGPGVPGCRAFAVEGLDAAVLAAIEDASRDYPAGIDTWLVAEDGWVVGLPRSCRIRVPERRER